MVHHPRYGQDDGWASRPENLDRFVNKTAVMLRSERNDVNIDGPAFVEAWRAIGGRGKPTYKGLRKLPERLDEAA